MVNPKIVEFLDLFSTISFDFLSFLLSAFSLQQSLFLPELPSSKRSHSNKAGAKEQHGSRFGDGFVYQVVLIVLM
jgi:hypothetical protein